MSPPPLPEPPAPTPPREIIGTLGVLALGDAAPPSAVRGGGGGISSPAPGGSYRGSDKRTESFTARRRVVDVDVGAAAAGEPVAVDVLGAALALVDVHVGHRERAARALAMDAMRAADDF